MNKQEWLEYFEAINGRHATAEEIGQALANGEFQDVAVAQAGGVQETVVEQVQETIAAPQPQQATQETVQPQSTATQAQQPNAGQQQMFQNVANNPQVADLKEKGRSYLSWFFANLKNPIVETSESHFIYGVVTVALAAIFMSGGIVNYLSRMFTSVMNITVSGVTMRESSPELFDAWKNAVNANLGLSRIFFIGLLLFALYAVAVALPALVNKYAENKSMSLKDALGRYASFTPLLALINFVALLVSFLTVDKLVISRQYSDNLLSSFTSNVSEPLAMLASVNELFEKIPAIASFKNVAFYLSILSILGFIVLVTAFVKNIKASYKALNNFYTTAVSLLVLLIVVSYVDKTIISQLLEAVSAIVGALTNS